MDRPRIVRILPGLVRILPGLVWVAWLGLTLVLALLREPSLAKGGPWALLFMLSALLTLLVGIVLVPRAIRRWLRHRPLSDTQLARAEYELAGQLLRHLDDAVLMNRWEQPAPMLRRWKLYTTDDTLDGSTADLSSLDAYRERSLLITSPEGNGKTMFAMLLIRHWLRTRADGDRVPVLVKVNGWDPRTVALKEWLAVQVGRTMGGLIGYRKIWNLVLKDRVVPVLDGADELIAEVRQAFTAAVKDGGPLVVIGREAFEMGADVLDLRPFREDDLSEHLALLTGTDCPPDSPIAQAIAPIVVGLMHHHPDPAQLADRTRFPDADAVQQELLALLVPVALRPVRHLFGPARRWNPQKAERWLAFLAHHLGTMGTSDLAWWRLREAFTPTEHELEAISNSGLRTEPSHLELSPRGRVKVLLRSIGFGLGGAFLIGGPLIGAEALTSVLGELGGENAAKIPEVIGVMSIVIGLALLYVGLGMGLMRFVQVPEVLPMPWTPSESLRRDRRMARAQCWIFGYVMGASIGLTIGVLIAKDEGQITLIAAGLIFAGPPGWLFGVLLGALFYRYGSTAGALYLHAVRRLARRKHLPRRLMPFLDDAYRAGLLRQQGAVYQFRYPWLQNRFAKKWPGV